jgi:hypothetical protein
MGNETIVIMVSCRVMRKTELLRLPQRASAVFDDPAVAGDWLNSPNARFAAMRR